ncbi:hypothetical protein AMECASPLE_013527 [Ameca splendens]|uniref:Uncharacterized protein n=1 Tax=Ameca splendens TaxID=208324 RepID=A0ABV0Y191_9TELE
MENVFVTTASLEEDEPSHYTSRGYNGLGGGCALPVSCSNLGGAGTWTRGFAPLKLLLISPDALQLWSHTCQPHPARKRKESGRHSAKVTRSGTRTPDSHNEDYNLCTWLRV